MNAKPAKSASSEREATAVNGWVMLTLNVALLLGAMAWFISIVTDAVKTGNSSNLWWLAPAALLEILAVLLLWPLHCNPMRRGC
jgi:hypothetical protein